MFASSSITRPAFTRAGQRTIAGTRIPPSSHEPLPPLSGAVVPVPGGGPLSLVKITIVFWSTPRSLSPFISSPTFASSHSTVSP